MPTLTVFTNFRINDEERFLRMKDSFQSFKDIDAQRWIVNVRGKYKLETVSFLQEHLGDKLSAHVIESGKGWFHDTRTMLPEIETDYVLYWVEDHISMVDPTKYAGILHDMQRSGSDFLFTSWWVFNQNENPYEGIEKEEYENIFSFLVDVPTSKKILSKCPGHYIISACGIFSSQLFKRVVGKNDPRLRRWPKETPFDLEKKGTDFHWLPIKTATSKYELFAPIDDDMWGYPGSLQTRGLYPKRVLRTNDTPKVTHWGLIKKITRHTIPALETPLLKVMSAYHKTLAILKRLKHHL